MPSVLIWMDFVRDGLDEYGLMDYFVRLRTNENISKLIKLQHQKYLHNKIVSLLIVIIFFSIGRLLLIVITY